MRTKRFFREMNAQASIEIIIAIGLLLVFVLIGIVDGAVKTQTANALDRDWRLSNECVKTAAALEKAYLSPGLAMTVFVNQDLNVQGDGNISARDGDAVAFCTYAGRSQARFIDHDSLMKFSNPDNNRVVRIETIE